MGVHHQQLLRTEPKTNHTSAMGKSDQLTFMSSWPRPFSCAMYTYVHISTFNIMYRWENPDRMAEYALLGENNTIVDRQRNMLLKFPFNFQFWSIIFGLFPNCVQKIKTVNNHDSIPIGHSFPLFLFIRKKVIVQESGPINALLWR